jgi:hypothetical protein
MRTWLVTLLFALICVGCASSPPPDLQITAEPASYREELSPPVDFPELDARVIPPRGWRTDLFEITDRHSQSVWVSPTGSAAYGVIHFNLPLPVGEEIALRGFLAEMKKSEGEATLLSKNRDGDRLRFVAEGGKYRIRGILLTKGFQGWAVYAGTLRSRALAVDELALAVQARENTALGLEPTAKASAKFQTRTSKSP